MPHNHLRSPPRATRMPGAWTEDSTMSAFHENWHRRKAAFRYNLDSFYQNPLGEVAGSVGDFGTTFPLMIAMASQSCISLTATLVFSGIANILTGAYFAIPIPIQPMKAVASVAIARRMYQGEVMAAGLSTSIIICFLAISGLLNFFNSLIPIPIVKGIQLGAGLSLILSSAKQLDALSWLRPDSTDNLIWFTVFFVLLFGTFKWRRFPLALIILTIGTTVALVKHPLPDYIRSSLHFYFPYWSEWNRGFLNAGVGQIPLTILNSVIATHHLSKELLPSVPQPGITELGLSVFICNIGCFFGAMPVCHGAGGLAAQYRFGAQSGTSMIILGLVKLFVGLLAGDALVEVLRRFPISYLAIMVFAAGVELCNAGEGLNSNATDVGRLGLSEEVKRDRWVIMIVTAGGMLAFQNVAAGFLAGIVCAVSFAVEPKLAKVGDGIRQNMRRRRRGETRALLRG